MRTLLLSTALMGVCAVNANAQKRMTLHEEFTGENCTTCAAVNPSFWTLCDLASNKTKLIHIAYMAPVIGAGPFYSTPAPLPMQQARSMYYTLSFGAEGRYDGVVPNLTTCGSTPGMVSCFTQADIDNEANVPSIFYINATHYFNAAHDSVFGKVVVTPSALAATSQHKLRIAFAKSMNFATPPGASSEKDFSNVVRAMFPDAGGITMASSMAAGVPVTYTYQGKIGGLETLSNFTTPDSMFVVWIQNDATKAIRQAARSTYVSPVGIDAMASSVSELNIFPNPANDQVNIQCVFGNPAATTITLTNMLGQVVLERKFEAGERTINENISLNSISSGVYFVTIAANGEKQTRKFTVSK
jgi:hypothetical protein